MHVDCDRSIFELERRFSTVKAKLGEEVRCLFPISSVPLQLSVCFIPREAGNRSSPQATVVVYVVAHAMSHDDLYARSYSPYHI